MEHPAGEPGSAPDPLDLPKGGSVPEQVPGSSIDSVGPGAVPAQSSDVNSPPKFRTPTRRAPQTTDADWVQGDPVDPDAPTYDEALTEVLDPELEPEADTSQEERPSRRRSSRSGRSSRDRRGGGSKALSGVSGVTGWKVATGFLTAIAVLAAGWGVYQTTKLAKTESAVRASGASAEAQIQALDARVAALEAQNTKLSADVADLQQQFTDFSGAVATEQKAAQTAYQQVSNQLSVPPAQYKSALGQSPTLSTAYLTAKAAADSAPGDQEVQIQSLEAKSALLTNCAQIWVGATQQIYEAETTLQTMTTVAKELTPVAPNCKVVTG